MSRPCKVGNGTQQRVQRTAQYLHNEYGGVLADTLEDEKPCPVCGSLHHPNPAKYSENAPDKDTLDALKARCEVAENAVHKSQMRSQGLKRNQNPQKQMLRNLRMHLRLMSKHFQPK